MKNKTRKTDFLRDAPGQNPLASVIYIHVKIQRRKRTKM